ncbi:MAG: 50S ribosomal protein L24 [Nanoarchaeota archaeon]
MAVCSFCKREYPSFQGVTLFDNVGRAWKFCSSKCRKNKELGRDSLKLKWTEKKSIVEEKAGEQKQVKNA